MKELTQVRRAVIEALCAGGMTAMEAFPAQRAKRYETAVAAVAVEQVKSGPMGFCSYLGEVYDPEIGTVRERYGKQLAGVISVEIRGESAGICEEGCELAADILLGRLPESIRVGELSWEAICWEKETGMFLRKGALHCQALFVAQTEEDAQVFLDFQLRGVMTSE